ncbi:hypothetical protein V8C86DRAFT_1684968 [Haematococcus lacustris]
MVALSIVGVCILQRLLLVCLHLICLPSSARGLLHCSRTWRGSAMCVDWLLVSCWKHQILMAMDRYLFQICLYVLFTPVVAR